MALHRQAASQMASESASFRYDSAIKNSHIRLLSMLLSLDDLSESAPFNCQLSTYSAIEPPPYVALSYVWGDATSTKPIQVNNKSFMATSTLADALQGIRNHHLFTVLGNVPGCKFWVDALCINQADMEERNSQVQIMGSIYANAQFVISWLGTDEQIGLALKTIEFIATELRTSRPPPNNFQWMIQYPELWHTDHSGIRFNNTAWRAISYFMKSTYWGRVWILQEVILAKGGVLMCGKSAVAFSDVLMFCQWYNVCDFTIKPSFFNPDLWQLLSTIEYSPLYRIMTLHRKFHRGNRNMGLQVRLEISTGNPLKATDPRDQIFGLMGLAGNVITPNYARSTEEVYTEWAEKWVQTSTDLSLLYMSGLGTITPGAEINLPSWVPNWQPETTASSAGLVSYLYGFYHPEQGLGGQRASTVVSADDGKLQLHAYGCAADTIDDVYSNYNFFELFFWCGTVMENMTSSHYITEIPLLQAIFRTLIQDKNCQQNAKPLDLNNSQEMDQLAMAFLRVITTMPGRTSQPESIELAEYLGIKINGDDLAGSFSAAFWETNQGSAALRRMFLTPAPAYLARITCTLQANLDLGVLFQTGPEGYLGMGPHGMRPDDRVVVLNNCSFPVVLRESDGRWQHVGTCFVLGLMDGEAARMVSAGKWSIERFEII